MVIQKFNKKYIKNAAFVTIIFHHPLFNALLVIILFVIPVSKRLHNSKCPICRTSKLVHHQLLEKQLTSYFGPCGYSKCKKKVFKRSVEQHSKRCYYQPAKCFICNCLVELNDLKSHPRLECN